MGGIHQSGVAGKDTGDQQVSGFKTVEYSESGSRGVPAESPHTAVHDKICPYIYSHCRLAGCGSYIPSLLLDRKSTRLNSSHVAISYAVFCLKKTITTLLP